MTADLPLGQCEIVVELQFQSCDAGICFPPTTKRFTVGLEAIEAGRGRLPAVAGWNRW